MHELMSESDVENLRLEVIIWKICVYTIILFEVKLATYCRRRDPSMVVSLTSYRREGYSST